MILRFRPARVIRARCDAGNRQHLSTEAQIENVLMFFRFGFSDGAVSGNPAAARETFASGIVIADVFGQNNDVIGIGFASGQLASNGSDALVHRLLMERSMEHPSAQCTPPRRRGPGHAVLRAGQRIMLAGICAVAIVSAGPLPQASATIFDDAPDAITCSFEAKAGRPGGFFVFYVDGRAEDGTVTYKTLGAATIQFSVNANGVIEAGNIAACNGKTVRELRDAGRAFDFHQGPDK